MRSIHIKASREYDVLVERGLLDRAGELLREVSAPGMAAIVSDDTVYVLYGERTVKALEKAGYRVHSFVFPAGEGSKNLSTYADVLHFLGEHRFSRSDVVVALGGGVVGDLSGFAAATYQRGMGFAQIPTTLLAAVDSSVGGKTAVDLPTGKNQAGSFYQPCIVICDPNTLETLPEEQYRCGCAEIIKYSMLGNAAFFEELYKTPVREQYEHVIEVCVQMKRDIVGADEYDLGRRRTLNLGHTFGHAVEQCSDFSLLHGEAVAIGMATVTRAAVKRGICGEETLTRLLDILHRYGLPTETGYPLDKLYEAELVDKKISGGKMHLIVPERSVRCAWRRSPSRRCATGCRTVASDEKNHHTRRAHGTCAHPGVEIAGAPAADLRGARRGEDRGRLRRHLRRHRGHGEVPERARREN